MGYDTVFSLEISRLMTSIKHRLTIRLKEDEYMTLRYTISNPVCVFYTAITISNLAKLEEGLLRPVGARNVRIHLREKMFIFGNLLFILQRILVVLMKFFDSFQGKSVTITILRRLKDKFSISSQFNRNCSLNFFTFPPFFSVVKTSKRP